MAGPPTDPPTDPPTGPPGMPHDDRAGSPGRVACPDCGIPVEDRFCESCGFDLEVPVPPRRPAAFTGRDVTLPSMRAVPQAAPVKRAAEPWAAEPLAVHPQAAEPHAVYPQAVEPRTANVRPPSRAQSPRPAPSWIAEIDADRAYFEANTGDEQDSLAFPSDYPRRRVQLRPPQVRIGRRSPARGLEPEIDLSGPPIDPGISHLHAVLLAQPDGGWQLIDPGSTNGTTLNGSTDPLATNVAVPVGDGDRIHLGAWTTITIRATKAS